MKKTLYVIRNLGFGKSTLYLVLYPLRFLRDALKKLDDIHDEIRWHKKICLYLKQAGLDRRKLPNRPIQNESKEYFKKYGLDVNTDWLHLYTELSGFESKYYIPEDLFYRQIEPCFINKRRSGFYGDKNMYDHLFEGVNQPETFLRYYNGAFYCPKYNRLTLSEALHRLQKVSQSWLIKPSTDSGNGKNIMEGKSQNGMLTVNGIEISLAKLANAYPSGFIIQERITGQNKLLSQFHRASLNTFRIMTIRLDNVIYTINRHVKFGTQSRIADNNGGIWCGVDSSGLIHTSGVDNKFQKINDHPDTGKSFKGTKIENFNSILDFSISLHKKVLRTDLVSWDIGLSENNEPIFIECNMRYQGISYHQALNGPLFGDLTDDVLEEVVRRRNVNRA